MNNKLTMQEIFDLVKNSYLKDFDAKYMCWTADALAVRGELTKTQAYNFRHFMTKVTYPRGTLDAHISDISSLAPWQISKEYKVSFIQSKLDQMPELAGRYF